MTNNKKKLSGHKKIPQRRFPLFQSGSTSDGHKFVFALNIEGLSIHQMSGLVEKIKHILKESKVE